MQTTRTFSEYAAELRAFIARHSRQRVPKPVAEPDPQFGELALGLFALHFCHNPAYRRWCDHHQLKPGDITDWRQIPAMPTAAFKEFELTSLAQADRTAIFLSSGTAEQRPSRHFHNRASLALYEASLLPWFEAHLQAGMVPGLKFIFLTPSPALAPRSSLVHMFETIRRHYPRAGAIFTGRPDSAGAWTLDFASAFWCLRTALEAQEPVAILGIGFNFVHLLEELATHHTRFHLPPGSWVLETGGYKGRSRAVPKPELYQAITEQLGIEADRIVSEYGMCELSSQAYDHALATATPALEPPERSFHFPPWARVRIISPETGQEAADGETGLIRVYDLANLHSVLAVQTEDLGIRRGAGFLLLGRANHVEPRGCSLMTA